MSLENKLNDMNREELIDFIRLLVEEQNNARQETLIEKASKNILESSYRLGFVRLQATVSKLQRKICKQSVQITNLIKKNAELREALRNPSRAERGMQGKIARQRIVLNRQLDIIYDLVTELEECGIRQDSSLLEEIERETTECWN